MTTIVTRAGKGSPLTNNEMDTNLTNLNSYKVEQDISGNATITGDVYLTGSSKRITGDFSNATIANRVMFQTSTVNGNSSVGLVPNGSGTVSSLDLHSTADPTNTSRLSLGVVGSSDTRITSDALGSGTALPMTFYTGGSERMRIDASGNVGIGRSPAHKFDVSASGAISGRVKTSGALNAFFMEDAGTTEGTLYIGTSGNDWRVVTNSVERLRVDATGNVLVTNAGGGLGYGTGAGGTVTQATSKSTTVTLNKPTGQITMNNAALAAGATVGFSLNNSLISVSDNIILTLQNGGAATGLNYNAWVGGTAAGVAVILIKNISGASLSESLVLNFAIIRGATA